MEKEKSSKRNVWDKADLLIKAFGVLFVSGAITFYGIYTENKRGKTELRIAAENNRSQLYAQTMNSRQAAKVDVLKGLLDILMKDYLVEDDTHRKLLKLNLLALNLQEQLHLKPLFIDLEAELSESPHERNKLRMIASQLKRGQVNRLVADGALQYSLKLSANESTSIEGNKIHVSVDLVLEEAREDEIIVHARFRDDSFGTIPLLFSVTYYDLPFLDNFPLKDLRYAVVLDNIAPDNSAAFVRLVIYPRDYFDIQDRIRVDRLIGR